MSGNESNKDIVKQQLNWAASIAKRSAKIEMLVDAGRYPEQKNALRAALKRREKLSALRAEVARKRGLKKL